MDQPSGKYDHSAGVLRDNNQSHNAGTFHTQSFDYTDDFLSPPKNPEASCGSDGPFLDDEIVSSPAEFDRQPNALSMSFARVSSNPVTTKASLGVKLVGVGPFAHRIGHQRRTACRPLSGGVSIGTHSRRHGEADVGTLRQYFRQRK